jgi:glycylpeptide N-tetradecanoyltransferase
MMGKDVPQVTQLLRTMLEKMNLSVELSEHEVAHWLIPKENVITTYVVEEESATRTVTDFLSFYTLPSSIVPNNAANTKHHNLKSAYSYYNVATTMSMKELMQDALIIAKSMGFDVFNALDITSINATDKESLFQDLRFSPGTGTLHYYLFNWRAPRMLPSDVGIVLV